MRYPISLAFIALLGAVFAAALAASVASAHVSVNPAQAPPNSSQTFTLRVPTEKDAPTVQLRVEFPTELTVSRFQPKPGWTRQIERDSQQRIVAATWSGGKIAAGEFDEFVFIARTPSQPGKLMLKAYQTYEGGETVAWVNPEEPNQAPSVEVKAGTDAAADDDHDESPALSAQGAESTAAPASSGLAVFASLAALVLAVAAVILAAVAIMQRRIGVNN